MEFNIEAKFGGAEKAGVYFASKLKAKEKNLNKFHIQSPNAYLAPFPATHHNAEMEILKE
jgi:hypothetical protein